MGKKAIIRAKKAVKLDSLGLAGLFVHVYEGEKIKYQGQIIGKEDDKVLVQMFEWGFGEPTNVQAFDKNFIYSGNCRLYRDIETWKERGDRYVKEEMRDSGD